MTLPKPTRRRPTERPPVLDALAAIGSRLQEARGQLAPGRAANKAGPVTGTPAPPAPINLNLSDVTREVEQTIYRLLNLLELSLGHTKVINLSRQNGRLCPNCQQPTLRFHVEREVAYCAFPGCADPDTGLPSRWTKSRLPFLADQRSA